MMERTRVSALALMLGLTMMLFVGCAQDTSPDSAVPGGAPAGGDMSTGSSVAPAEPVEATPVAGDEHASPAAANVKLSEDEIAQVSKLPDEADRAAALAQMVCPIGEDIDTKKPNHLGSMGMPIKKVVDGKAYFLCCKGCEADFDKDPQAAIAKLAKK